ncbi:hypothetical protein BV25DRAFT_279706 [Artomyces pyxidatus]|uniref:Uncharacterized protein n=1 Tax=Artomyces pyxidatus TaxID=48021 RepID=A0ACB8T7C9_9AGAM|nr:hypothetical protein BV25DRAFT_279706 [Artomyces pyxidatus]
MQYTDVLPCHVANSDEMELDADFLQRALLSAKTSVDLIYLALAAKMASGLKQKAGPETSPPSTEDVLQPPPAHESTEAREPRLKMPVELALQLFFNEHMAAFNKVLYVEEYEKNNKHQTLMLGHMMMWSDQGLPMDKQLRHLECIIDFLNACKTTPMPMPGFYTWLQKTNRPLPEQWRGDGQSTAYLWEVVAMALTFHGSIKYNDKDNVHDIVRGLFPVPSASRYAPTSFQVSFRDLLSVKFDLRPTHFLHEHLMVEGNIVKFYYLSTISASTLSSYRGNKIARAVDLDTVGDEILASWAALLGDRTIEPEARARSLLEEDKNALILVSTLIKGSENIRPHYFADREAVLRKLIAQRRRWWNVLMRDVRDQREDQPFMFYGAILAVFFGVCTVIQTVTAVWGLVLAAKA